MGGLGVIGPDFPLLRQLTGDADAVLLVVGVVCVVGEKRCCTHGGGTWGVSVLNTKVCLLNGRNVMVVEMSGQRAQGVIF